MSLIEEAFFAIVGRGIEWFRGVFFLRAIRAESIRLTFPENHRILGKTFEKQLLESLTVRGRLLEGFVSVGVGSVRWWTVRGGRQVVAPGPNSPLCHDPSCRMRLF
jgi:hypothetical protein